MPAAGTCTTRLRESAQSVQSIRSINLLHRYAMAMRPILDAAVPVRRFLPTGRFIWPKREVLKQCVAQGTARSGVEIVTKPENDAPKTSTELSADLEKAVRHSERLAWELLDAAQRLRKLNEEIRKVQDVPPSDSPPGTSISD